LPAAAVVLANVLETQCRLAAAGLAA